MRVVDADYLEGERTLAQAVARGDAEATHAHLAALGYLPEPDTFDPERLLEQIRTAGEWYLEPGFRRLTPGYVADLLDRSGSPRSPFFEDMRRETIPPQALLIRRMEGLVLSTLGELRAGADWSALGSEYWGDAPPSTPLGEQDAAVLGITLMRAAGGRVGSPDHARRRPDHDRPAPRPADRHRAGV